MGRKVSMNQTRTSGFPVNKHFNFRSRIAMNATKRPPIGQTLAAAELSFLGSSKLRNERLLSASGGGEGLLLNSPVLQRRSR